MTPGEDLDPTNETAEAVDIEAPNSEESVSERPSVFGVNEKNEGSMEVEIAPEIAAECGESPQALAADDGVTMESTDNIKTPHFLEIQEVVEDPETQDVHGNDSSQAPIKPAADRPEIPRGVVARILKLDEDIKSKKFRLQRDSLQAISSSIALFVKLLTKTCEVVHSTSTTTGVTKRMANTLDVEHLGKAIKRYEVLGFLGDMVSEMNQRVKEPTSLGSLDDLLREPAALGETVATNKRKQELEEADESSKKQRSITSFFTRS